MTAQPGDLLEASIEAVARADVDIVPAFFERFYAAHPEQRDNFNRPGATQGAMVNEMLTILGLLADDKAASDALVADCLARHHSYGDIAGTDFTEAVQILMETMQAAAGPAWLPDYSTAWSTLLGRLQDCVERTDR